MPKSQKFKLLEEYKMDSNFAKHIPNMYLVREDLDQFRQYLDGETFYILRSALDKEGDPNSLNPGKSLSHFDITNFNQFERSYRELRNQKRVVDIVLQEQFHYEYHITFYLQRGFCYAQYSHRDTEESSFFTVSEDFVTGKFAYQKRFLKFLEKFRGFNDILLIEMGINSDDEAIFQISKCYNELFQKVFNDDLLVKIVKSRINQRQNRHFFGLIKTEWQAKSFRAKAKEGTVSEAFKNWEYIFHYFGLFCRRYNKSGTDQDFVEFLNSAQNKKWPGELIKEHIKLANHIRKHESVDELPSCFRHSSENLYFITNEINVEGPLNEVAKKVDILTPELIYAHDSKKILLTPDNQLLGHAILAAAENEIPIVANMDRQLYNSLSEQDVLSVDFTQKLFEVKS